MLAVRLRLIFSIPVQNQNSWSSLTNSLTSASTNGHYISALDSGRRRYKATSFHTNTIPILFNSIHHTNILNCSCHWFLLLFVDCPHHHVQNNKIFTGINILYLSAYKKSGSEPQSEDKESLRSPCCLLAAGGVLTYAKLGSIYSFSIYSRLYFQ